MTEKFEIFLEEFALFALLAIQIGQSCPMADAKELLCDYIMHIQKLNKNEV